jgi:hypothetical protein
MGIHILRSTALAAAGAGSAWEDVTVGYSSMPAQLGGTDGRKVRMDLTGTDWGTQLGTGASATRIVGGAYDGTDSIRLIPPTIDDNYACIMRFLDLSNGGTKNVSQVNLGFCIRWGSRYWDLGHTAKVTGILGANTLGDLGVSNARCGFFEAFKDAGGGDLRRVPSVTSTTLASYHEPESGYFQDTGPDTDKLFILGSTSNHANNPPLIATEWLYCEQEVDLRQNRGNTNGRNRLDVWARDGYLGFLDIELTWNPAWDFSYQYGGSVEYIGGYWNQHATADANNFVEVSHPIVAVNRAKDQRIGPPTGSVNFLT